MKPLRIALLGAESTGKTALSQALAQSLRTHGLVVALVPEVLREWCAQAGRTPQPHEQLGIAQAQALRVDEAELACPNADIVIADTTPLMIAIYSDMLFADCSLYDFALAHQRGYAMSLLMGLDLPWVADGLQRDGPHVQAPVDALVRAAMDRAALPYQTVYGCGLERLAHAQRALRTDARIAARIGATPEIPARGSWQCDTCSDGDCEHRLFRRLLAP
jgi:nicotinamide riboside kinase